jgi:hypothetical protein
LGSRSKIGGISGESAGIGDRSANIALEEVIGTESHQQFNETID